MHNYNWDIMQRGGCNQSVTAYNLLPTYLGCHLAVCHGLRLLVHRSLDNQLSQPK